MRRLRVLGLALGLGMLTLPAAGADVAPSKPAAERKLPELPTPPSLELKRPDPADLAEVDALLSRIVGDTAQDREGAVRELLEAEPKHVAAIRFRIGSLADSADKEAMKRLLLKTRRELLGRKDDA